MLVIELALTTLIGFALIIFLAAYLTSRQHKYRAASTCVVSKPVIIGMQHICVPLYTQVLYGCICGCGRHKVVKLPGLWNLEDLQRVDPMTAVVEGMLNGAEASTRSKGE